MRSFIPLFKMSFLFFCQFFLQGIWSMTLGLVLNSHGMGDMIKTTFLVLGIATIISPIFIGYITDRVNSPKNIFCCLHLINGINFIFLFFAFHLEIRIIIIPIIFITGLLFYPTTSLINSLSFQNLRSDKQFPVMRAFGTIGFMASGFVMGIYNIEGSYYLFVFSAIVSLVISLSIIRLQLEQNPLKSKNKTTFIKSFGEMYSLIDNSNSKTTIICAILLMISQLAYSAFIPVYLVEIGIKSPTSIMQLAVFTELILMFLLPTIMSHISIEKLILVGCGFYFLRNFMFWKVAEDLSLTLVFLALVCQGMGWVLFYIVFDVLVKKISTTSNLHQMQGLKVILINGIGTTFASIACGIGYNYFVLADNAQNWQSFWLLPGITSGLCLFFLLTKRKIIFS